MFNLLRMDLYRLRRCKSVYICLAFLLVTIFLCYGLVYLTGTPEGQELAPKIGMRALAETEEKANDMLAGVDSTEMLRQSCMDGGLYNLLFGIVAAIFFCTDFQSGFVKNIMALHRKRWKYIASKLITLGILDFCYIALCFALNMLLNQAFHRMVPYAALKDALFYLAWLWLLTMAFAALEIMVCSVTRSMAAGIAAASMLSCGLIVMPLAALTRLFLADGWYPYTIYYNVTYGPSAYAELMDLKVFAVGIVFLAIYAITSVIPMVKKDI